MTLEPSADVDELLALLETTGRAERTAAGERVGALAHGLQCAHELALAAPDDLEMQVAGLLHDIGHELAPGDDAGHGRAGADAVRPVLGDRVADLVELHVPAKRYLVSVDPTYDDVLSDVSRRTLERQGGPMTPAERAVFAGHPCAADALELRRADEAAKVPGRVVPGLERWRPLVRLLARKGSPR